MSQPKQQVIPGIAEQALDWQLPQLVVPTKQIAYLQDGGAQYVPDFISSNEETDLLIAIDAEAWQTDLRRRVQHYGYRYNYSERNINVDDRLGTLPQWIKIIVDRLLQKKIFISPPDQLIINEYEPGQGIAPHTDRDCFGPIVASISLGSDCMMRTVPHYKRKQDAFDIVLQHRSLLVLQGESRDVWRHGIEPKKSDRQYDHKIPRQRRVSLTFRTVEI